MHLPYPCIYIKAPGLLEHTDGFFAWIEYDINAQRPELRVQWQFEDMAHSFPQVLHLMPGEDLKTCITRRGHWHHYWTGPRDGERTLILKWTAPTVIHPEDREGNVTLYPVR